MNKLVLFSLAVCTWTCCIPRIYSRDPQFALAYGSPIKVEFKSGQVFLADFNGDGHLDLLSQHPLPGKVLVQLGDGKGHFAPDPERSLSLDFRPEVMAVGDVDNDGGPDVVIGTKNRDQERIHVFLNDTRKFRLAGGSPFIVSEVRNQRYKPDLRLIDLNGDLKLDIISKNNTRKTIEIFLGNGRGGFSPAPALPSGPRYYPASFGDIDGDDLIDLVTLIDGQEEDERLVELKRGDGKGDFSGSFGKPVSAPPRADLQLIADVNGDGRLDIVLKHGERKRFTILVNEGEGRLRPLTHSPLEFELGAFSAVAADMNRDKYTDLVFATVNNQTKPFESKIVVLLGDERGLSSAPGSPFNAGPGAYNITIGDANSDGKLDIVASSSGDDALTLLLGK